MTRQKWTTDEQEAWLLSHMTAYLAANQTKSAAKVFFPDVVKEFREKWPMPPVTAAEIKDAGSAEFALRVQKSKYDKRTTQWFPNKAREATSSGSGGNRVLKIKAPSQPKKMQPWQAYQALTYKMQWKAHVDQEWADYKASWETEHPGEKPPKSRLEIMVAIMKQKYDEADEEMKERCARYRESDIRDEATAGSSKTDEDINEELQKVIDKLPRTLISIGSSVLEQTGWFMTVIMGGPVPGSGDTMSYISHTGKTKDGKSFKDFLGKKEYDEHIQQPFDQFLRACFNTLNSPEVVRESSEVKPVNQTTDRDPKEGANKENVGKEGNSETKAEGKRRAIEDIGQDGIQVKDTKKTPNDNESANQPSQYELDKARNMAELKGIVERLKEDFPVPAQEGKEKKKGKGMKGKVQEADGGKAVEIRQSTRLKEQSDVPSSTPQTTAKPVSTTPKEGPSPTDSSDPKISTSDPPTTNLEAKPTGLSASLGPSPLNVASNSNPLVVLPQASDAGPGDEKSQEPTSPLGDPTPNPISAGGEPSQDSESVPDDSNVSSDAARALDADSFQKELVVQAGSPKDSIVEVSVDLVNDTEVQPDAPVVKDPPSESHDAPANQAADVEMTEIPPQQPHKRDDVRITEVNIPPWLQPMFTVLRNASNDAVWRRLVEAFLAFENSGPSTSNLPTKFWPKEISDWIKSKKKNVVPSINFQEYGSRFIAWWIGIQPAWRKIGETPSLPLLREVPDGEMWQALRKGGTAGMYVVLMGLSWWVMAQPADGSIDLWIVVDDILWVLQQFNDGNSAGTKRAHDGEATDSDRPNKSRRISS